MIVSRLITAIHMMLVQCWTNVAGGGPALGHHRVNASYLLGSGIITNDRDLLFVKYKTSGSKIEIYRRSFFELRQRQ